MKTRCFLALGVAGMILLAGNLLCERAFGSEVRWGKPKNSEEAPAPVTHIPTVLTTDDEADFCDILQVQQVEEVLLPQITLPTLPSTTQAPTVPTAAKPLEPCSDQSTLMKSIREISHDIRPAFTELPDECSIDSQPFIGRHFSQSCFMWKASAVSTQAAYFEDVQLERYGHTKVGPALQPIVSGARFFATIPILPYKMGVTPPNECVYTLGHVRAGNYAPYMREPFPVSPRGALFQAGAVTGAVFALP